MTTAKLTIVGDVNSQVRVMSRQQTPEGDGIQIWAGPLGTGGRVTIEVSAGTMAILSPGMKTGYAEIKPGQAEVTVRLERQ
jgi:hypothetical protein